jgi:hypothetical protein
MKALRLAAAAAVCAGALFALLAMFPVPPLGRAFLAVGRPLGFLILEFAPDALMRGLAPQGGPDAVAWAYALGSLLTWFALFFGAGCLLLRLRAATSRRRSAPE